MWRASHNTSAASSALSEGSASLSLARILVTLSTVKVEEPRSAA